MLSAPLQRPIGFAPGEIAALVHHDVVSQHAAEAAFLWRLRRRAATEPHFALKDLAALDRRVEAHLVGLRVAGEHGWHACRSALERDGPGEIFALSVLAFASGERSRMWLALQAAAWDPRLRTGLVSALGWLDHTCVAPWLRAMLGARAPQYRLVALAAAAIHRRDPGSALAAAIEDTDMGLRVRALKAVGELKRRDLAEPVRAHLTDPAPEARLWAAWTLCLLGDRGGLTTLMACADEAGPLALPAMQLGLRLMAPALARAWVRAQAARSDRRQLAVFAAGIFGDPASVPWLIQAMEDPLLCRLAGEAFTCITGIDLAYHDLVQADAPPLGDDAGVGSDAFLPAGYAANLQWPSAALVDCWWRGNAARFASGQRYLGGRPAHRDAAIAVLAQGRQRQRIGAALELACTGPELPLLEVRESGERQQQRLVPWTS